MNSTFGVRDIDYLQDMFSIEPKIGFSTTGGTLCVWRFWDGKPANRAEVVLKRNCIELYIGELTKCYEEVLREGEPYMCMSLKHSQFEAALRFNTMGTAEPILKILVAAYKNENLVEDNSMVSKEEVMKLVSNAVADALKMQQQKTSTPAATGPRDKEELENFNCAVQNVSYDSLCGGPGSLKGNFDLLLKKQGYKSINAFAKACGISVSSITSLLNGKSVLSIDRAFSFANVLGIRIEEVIEVFYPEKMTENRNAVNRLNKYIENDVTNLSDADLFKEEFY